MQQDRPNTGQGSLKLQKRMAKVKHVGSTLTITHLTLATGFCKTLLESVCQPLWVKVHNAKS